MTTVLSAKQQCASNLQSFLSLAATNQLPNSRHQEVHGCYCLVIRVQPHVEGLHVYLLNYTLRDNVDATWFALQRVWSCVQNYILYGLYLTNVYTRSYTCIQPWHGF